LDIRKKNSRRKKLKTQGKKSKLKVILGEKTKRLKEKNLKLKKKLKTQEKNSKLKRKTKFFGTFRIFINQKHVQKISLAYSAIPRKINNQ